MSNQNQSNPKRTYTTETETFLTMAKRGDFVVLDTETTGLERGEIIQIAIVDAHGKVWLDTFVKPMNGIPNTHIHGIDDSDVADAPSWALIAPAVRDIVRGRDLIVYNAVYDRKMMHQSAEACQMPKTEWKEVAHWYCAMLAYAEVYGDWNDYRQSYAWQKLTVATQQQGLNISAAHTALGDALMTLALVKKLASLHKGEFE